MEEQVAWAASVGLAISAAVRRTNKLKFSVPRLIND